MVVNASALFLPLQKFELRGKLMFARQPIIRLARVFFDKSPYIIFHLYVQIIFIHTEII